MAQRYAERAEIIGAIGVPGGVAPEFNALTDAQLLVWTDVAASIIGVNRWRERASIGHALLTAHLLASTSADGSLAGVSGPIASETDGPASVSYANWAPTDAELGSTGYGRAYLLVRRVVQGSGVFVVPNRRLRLR